MKTRIIRRFAAVIAVLVTFCFLTSCQSKEEKVISQLELLCKTVEKDSFSVDDIDSLQARFDAVRETAKECDFTNEQLKEVAKLEARFTKAIAKKAIERVGSALEGIVDGLSGDN